MLHYNTRSKATLKANRLHNWFHYFITIQSSRKKEFVSPDDLLNIKRSLKTKFSKLQVYKSVFELGSCYKQLHLHLLLRLPHSVYFKDSSKMLGYRLYWRKIYDLSSIDHYLEKDSRQYTQNDVITLNHLNHNYGFI